MKLYVPCKNLFHLGSVTFKDESEAVEYCQNNPDYSHITTYELSYKETYRVEERFPDKE